MTVQFIPIGFVRHGSEDVPRHCSVSDLEGELEILPEYAGGLVDIIPGQSIVVLFHFDRSEPFGREHLRQKKRHKNEVKGVFSICSSIRPNPIGLSVLTVMAVEGCGLRVKGLDMFDGTPILDIKPHMECQPSKTIIDTP